MANLREFHSLVREHVSPTPPKSVIDSSLIRALRRFCQRTGIYTHNFTLTTTVGDSLYDLSLAEGLDLLLIPEQGARESGKNRFLQTISSESKVLLTGKEARPEFILVPGPTAIKLIPTPDEVYQYDIEAEVQPKLNATEISDDIYHQWAEPIAFGAAYYLSTQKGKGWYDLDSANYLKMEFERGIHEAINRKVSGFANEELVAHGNGWIL